MTTEGWQRQIREATLELARAELTAHEARVSRNNLIRAAYAERVRVSDIAKWTEMARKNVYHILNQP